MRSIWLGAALMVTHSMQQAVPLPDQIVMMHKGRIVRRYTEEEKARIGVLDFPAAFDSVRRREMIDIPVAALLTEQYQ